MRCLVLISGNVRTSWWCTSLVVLSCRLIGKQIGLQPVVPDIGVPKELLDKT